jgi:hypothetical protein
MPLPFANDLTVILDVDDFATAVTYSGGTINGIFDNETVPVDAGGFVPVHEEQPRLTCRTVDIPSIAYDQTMVILGVTYKVKAWVHDGTGVTVVQLERQ